MQGYVAVDSAYIAQEPTQVEGLMLDDVEAYGVGTLGIATAPSNGWCVKGLDLVGHKKFNDWLVKYGLSEADAKIISESLANQIDGKTIHAVEEATTGRFVIQADRGAKTNKAFIIEKNQGGSYVVNKYEPTYDPTANTNIDVDISTNSYLAPDYSTKGGKYLYPSTALQSGQSNIVRIEMTGDVTKDYKLANSNAGFSNFGEKAPKLGDVQYAWHHLDDFEYDFNTGKSYCKMQLVERDVHTKVTGMAHSGGASQYRTFHGTGY